jgi:hypothetical protein
VAGNDETKGPIEGFVGLVDADAGGHQRLGDGESVVAHLKSGLAIRQIQSVVAGAQDTHCLAEAAGAGGQLAGEADWGSRSGLGQSAVAGHLFLSGDGFERADQYAASLPPGLTRNVHAGVAAIDDIDVGIAGVAEKHQVTRSGPAVGVGGGVGRIIVRAEIGLGFHDAAGEEAGVGSMDQELAQQAGRNKLGTVLEEGPGEKAAGKGCGFSQYPIRQGWEGTRGLPPLHQGKAQGWGTEDP